jgi:hypothetical protein
MAVGPRLRPSILDKGILASKRGVWFIFNHPKLGQFGIINVYAPTGNNGPKELTELWKEILELCQTILRGF